MYFPKTKATYNLYHNKSKTRLGVLFVSKIDMKNTVLELMGKISSQKRGSKAFTTLNVHYVLKQLNVQNLDVQKPENIQTRHERLEKTTAMLICSL